MPRKGKNMKAAASSEANPERMYIDGGKDLPKTKNTMSKTRKITVTAMLSALAAVLMLLDFSLPMLIPGFVKMDFSELPALLASFAIGPVWGAAVCLVKNLFNLLLHSSTGGIGELCNFLLGAVFVFTAGMIYKRGKNRKSAIIGALIGALVMAVVSVPVNYFISYPVYAKLFGGLDKIIAAYEAIRPGSDGLFECLLIFNLPFTFIKGLIDALIMFLIYKPVAPLLKGR